MKSNSVKSMKLLYVAPRYHTNQVPIMRGFHKYDCKVMFMAQYEGVNEVHDNVDFYLLKKSPVAKWIFRFIDKKGCFTAIPHRFSETVGISLSSPAGHSRRTNHRSRSRRQTPAHSSS